MWYETYIEILWRTAHGPVLLSVTVRVGLSALRAPTNAIGAAPDLCARTRSTRRVHTRAPTVQFHRAQTDRQRHTFLMHNFGVCKTSILCEPAQCTQRSRVQSAVEHSLRANYRERERRDSETLVTRRGTRLARAPTRRKKGRAATRVFSLQPCPCSRACRASRKARSSSNCHVSPPGRQG